MVQNILLSWFFTVQSAQRPPFEKEREEPLPFSTEECKPWHNPATSWPCGPPQALALLCRLFFQDGFGLLEVVVEIIVVAPFEGKFGGLVQHSERRFSTKL